MEISHQCKTCKSVFFRKKNRTKKYFFCSPKCMGEFKKKTVIVICDMCQKEMRRYPSIVSINNFCSGKCRGHFYHGYRANRWKGGITKLNSGYLFQLIGINKYYAVHRIKMEKHLGRKLKSSEIVHHKNMDKTDNRIENLEIMNRSNLAT